MLKHVTVPIIVDDHEPEKCSKECDYFDNKTYSKDYCALFDDLLFFDGRTLTSRCQQCLEEAK